ELNFRFLELPQHAYFPGPLGASLQTLSVTAKRALACAPFSLFSVPLTDPVSFSLVRDAEIASTDAFPTEWVTAVSFFVWHLAHTDSFTLSMLCNLEEAHAERLRSLSVTAVADIATGLASAIRPRWTTNAYFWPAAIQCAASFNAAGMQTLFCLGRQLLARDHLAIPAVGREPRRKVPAATVRAKPWKA
ncbi:MAG TPA: hypothetical protein VK629_11860, partial [Steroidobacteraceae bacterium]|nr:hypothetical protein [Steroidobacteraceae bacterium]